jgi:integrase
MSLTNIAITKAKQAEKPYKLSDSGGLYLQINTSGTKCWRFKYRFAGKEKVLSLGVYPHLSLLEARERRDLAKRNLANDLDPGALKQTQKYEAGQAATNTFQAVACEWHDKNKIKWVPKNAARNLSILERHIFPFIGKISISKVKSSELLHAIRKIEARGNAETAHRVLQICGQIFRYAIATDRANADLSLVLKGALSPVKVKHHASITEPSLIGAFLRDIHGYQGAYLTQQALKLAPLVFVRPGELRHAEWSEIDFDKAEWRIAAPKMKMKVTHIVPLSNQALQILKEIHEHTGHLQYVFTGVTSTKRPMSENTVNMALRRMGYEKSDMTGHGFRSMASTILHEQGWLHDAIERQLAHSDKNKVSAAYNYAEHLPKRKNMMQDWANYLDALRVGAEVIPINGKRA